MKKKIVLLIILFFGMITFVNAEDVEIIDIELIEKSDTAEILSDPTYNNLDANFDIKFNELNDYVKYKITLKNLSSTDYKVELDKKFDSDKYFDYSYEIENGKSIIFEEDELVVYVILKYSNEIEEETYVSQNDMSLKFSITKTKYAVENPFTSVSDYIIKIVTILIISLISLLMIINIKKNKKV